MAVEKRFNHQLSTFGWGALLVWWGVSVMIQPPTVAMSAMGTGVIMLGINAVRALKGIRLVHSTTVVGLIALVWGALDQARIVLGFSSNLSLALLLIVIGLVTWFELLLRPKKAA